MLRWFSPYFPADADAVWPQSVGLRDHGDGGDAERLWWQSKRDDARAPSWAPVQAIIARFVYSPVAAPTMVRYEGVEEQRAIYHRGKAKPLYNRVFRTCPLPVAMLL